MNAANAPILVLDSGLGGLTVAAAIRSALPRENIIYFGDTARVPYGSKCEETVTRYMLEIIRFLLPHRPKHIVIACNTATALSLPALNAEFQHIPITGVIEPGAAAAVKAAGNRQAPVIAVIATQATVDSRAYETAIHRRRSLAELIVRATPLLVPIIEDGRRCSDPLVKVVLRQYLQPLVEHHPDVLVLGCTHYPIFKPSIEKIMGRSCLVIDSAEFCAQDVAAKLMSAGLIHSGQSGGRLRCFVTDGPRKFQRLAMRFAGMDIELPTLVSMDELAAGPRQMAFAAA